MHSSPHDGTLVNSDTFTGGVDAHGRRDGRRLRDPRRAPLTLSANYQLTFVSGQPRRSRRAVTVTANADEKVYGDADPTCTHHLTVGSLVNSDTFTGGVDAHGRARTIGGYGILAGHAHPERELPAHLRHGAASRSQARGDGHRGRQDEGLRRRRPRLHVITCDRLPVNGDTVTGELTGARRGPRETLDSYGITQGTLARTPTTTSRSSVAACASRRRADRGYRGGQDEGLRSHDPTLTSPRAATSSRTPRLWS